MDAVKVVKCSNEIETKGKGRLWLRYLELVLMQIMNLFRPHDSYECFNATS
jgi:hypothetical protein